MFELLFFIMFVGILFFTGLSMMTVFIALGVTMFVMFLMGMIGFVIKLLPWIIVIAIGVWFYKNYITTTR
ncbi:envelope stress response protein PspG [Vibrio algarum]|uniref:Envelope stress response protein PspG n=1 Tax=Vibrio algarum TaxID=3020714 RepID=A0ABT4YMS4_9VIBR|nr:envelope stress response protein PspG [Vibrio sp. KJ40-1]MDB1122846.1 envelope stress response protein PspG [Vibrio sp. KJ40-1]